MSRMYSAGMRRALQLHPSSIYGAVDRIDVQAARRGRHYLALDYRLSGDLSALRLPTALTPKRGDKLWQSTCLEAFVSASTNNRYLEFNIAPSMEWAAYRFDGYRSNMRAIDEFEAPHTETSLDKQGFQMSVLLSLGKLSDLPADAVWHLGLSAVIEDTSGEMSYWALTHPPGIPDFHHAECFALRLPPKEQTTERGNHEIRH